jgi:glycosyltransferase involved in cell wall biosynthesis
MSRSKPVISTDCAGIKDLIVDGENGLLFTLGHEKEILQAYEKLRIDPLFTKSLIENAKITANNMGPGGFIPKVLSIIEN